MKTKTFNKIKFNEIIDRIKLDYIKEGDARFIIKGLILGLLATLLEFIGLVLLFWYVVNIWLAIIISYIARRILIHYNFDGFYMVYNFVFRNSEEMLGVYEYLDEDGEKIKNIQKPNMKNMQDFLNQSPFIKKIKKEQLKQNEIKKENKKENKEK